MGYPFYVKPLKLLTNVSSLSFNKTMPRSIVEGQKFGSKLTPIIQVKNSSNLPIAGKLVIALINNFNGKEYPKRYVSVRKGYKSKHLLNPFPGNYSESSDNPLSLEDPVIPILTNEKGYAFFNDSYFSKYGPYGKYKVEFICDGVNIISAFVNVNTLLFDDF